jgi:hypothetical protein
MDPTKARRYALDTGREFPPFTTLSIEESAAVRRKLVMKLRLPEDTPGSVLARHVRGGSEQASDRGIESDHLLLSSVIGGFTRDLQGSVLLNWAHWEEIDRMACRDLIDRFHDIWYPKTDDLDVLDEAFAWIVSIDHDGWIYSADLRFCTL